MPAAVSATVQLVFLGEVLSGFRLEDVQRDLGRALKADEARLKVLFSGRRAVLRRDLPDAEAPRYVARLAALGAKVHIEPMAAPSARELSLQPIEHDEPAPVEGGDEVTCPKCGERQPKRLLCRACATNIEMALAAKVEEDERRRAERQAKLDALRARRRGRVHDDDRGERSAWPIGFGFSGRVARLTSATAGVWLFTALLLLTVGFLQRPSLPRVLLMGAGALAVFFFSMRLTVLRCHDCDRHGWWALMVLVPYVGSVASLLVTFLPGNPEANEYGPPPPRGRWRWFAVALGVFAVSCVMLFHAAIGFVERQAELRRQHAADHEVIELGTTEVAPADIQEAFQRDYAGAPANKAFAASSRRAWGWSGNAPTVQQAVRDALAQCNAKRPAYTAECQVVNINGQNPR
jgi:uncharacterized membrane protein YhaH (DUF805 family)